jgi:drug/metabolite transporter (DMT)-like permease
MKPSYLIILLVLNFCWGGVYSAYKVIGQGRPAGDITGAIVTLRFGLAGLCLLIAWPWLPGPAPRGRDLLITCLMGLTLYVLGQRLQIYGTQIGTAGNSSVLMALEPVLVSVAAAIFLREKIGPRRWAGFVLGLFGVAVLHGIWRKDFQWTSLEASLIFVSSFICEAAYSILGKPISSRASIIKMLALSLLLGTATNLLIDGSSTFAVAKALPPVAWVLLLALAVICTALGYTMWFVIIKECPINVAALTVFAQTIFGVAIAALWVREELHWPQLLGSLVIISAGLVLGLSRQVHRQPQPRQVEAEAPNS